MLSRLFPCFIVSAALFASPLRGADSHVKASLVAAETSIQPGRPFTVALHLEHEPHWHTYWINAGTGYPTSLAWKLPDGFKAGEIQWPVPSIIHDSHGTITGNGYEDETFLPVQITPPALLKPGETVSLRAHADWLMCNPETCVPGQTDVSLTLPVSDEAPKPDETWGQKIRAVLDVLPRSDSAWKVFASRDAQTVTLTVTPTREIGPLARPINDLHFFSEDGFIAYDQPQKISPNSHGGFMLTLPIAESGPKNPPRLIGVLTSAAGWRTDSELRGLRIDVPIEAAGTGAGSKGQVSAATNSSATPQPPASLAATLLLAFVGGLILNLMPCVFPVLGIKILGFVQQAGNERRKVAAHGLIFSLGVVVSFWALAGLLAALHAGGHQLGWGFQLQSPAFVFALAAVLLIFALNMSGVFEFGLGATSIGGELQTKSGLAGTFFSGVLATIVATPCSAPFLAPALGAALALPVAQSFIVFTAIALGLSSPYLFLSAFPGAVKLLPRPGAWMETFKQLMAFPLYATVAFLVWVLVGQLGEAAQLPALVGLVLVALAAWLYGRWHAPGAKPARARFGLLGGAVVLAAGLWLGWPRAAAPTDITWEPWSAERVATLQAEGRLIYVDFTARWCATCQANKKFVFSDREVLKTFRDKKIATLRADWTNRDPRITAELAKYGRSAVPFDLLYLPGRTGPTILPELLTPGIVLGAIEKK